MTRESQATPTPIMKIGYLGELRFVCASDSENEASELMEVPDWGFSRNG